MTQFELYVEATIKKHNMLSVGDTVVAGVSGGADSVAMLHTLCSLRDKYKLHIICAHLNHGIRGQEAQRDTDYVELLCSKLGVECITEYRDIPAIAAVNKQSEELAGRNERYMLFEKLLDEAGGGKIAVAHNKNDSVETVLIKLTRGCSLNGLRGIAPVNGNIIRPLIECDRTYIERYLHDIDVPYMTDSTNSDNIYTRNIIRNSVIPVLQSINPGFVNTVFANSRLIGDDDDYIQQCCMEHCKKCVSKTDDNVIIDLKYFRDLHISVKKRIILYAVSIFKGDKTDIEQKHIDILMGLLPTGKKFDLSAGVKAYIEYDRLIICSSIPESDDYEYIVDFDRRYNINGKCINFELTDNNDIHDTSYMYIDADNIADKKIILRNRRPGDRFSPSGMNGSKKLKSYFIDSKIPQTERNTIPLLCIDDEIAVVLGHRVSSKFVVTDKTKNLLKISFTGGTND